MTGRAWRSLLVIVVVSISVYWNSFPGTFLLDDFASIHDNPSIRSLATSMVTPRGGQAVAGRPIASLSLAINYAAGGLQPTVYHATNFLIHVSCALPILVMVRLILDTPHVRELGLSDERRAGIALCAALVWLVHPLQTEPVNYIVARTESLMALFALATLSAFLRAALREQHRGRWQAASFVVCAVGMGCKESMVVVPVLAVLLDRALVFESFREAIRRRGRFYASLASTLLIAAWLTAGNPRANSAASA